MDVKIEHSWKKILQDEFDKPYFEQVTDFLKTEKSQGKIIYPAGPQIFNAFEQTPFNTLKVVLLGQDPYHGAGQAMGLSFSVPDGVTPPPSLKNIFKELNNDIGMPIPATGNLTPWARQGVLLLNASLTVRAGEPNSHSKFGRHTLYDSFTRKINEPQKKIVFLLWGSFARQKKLFIDGNRHLILETAHPSPFSVDKFYHCKHFSKTNKYLVYNGISPIDWSVSS